MKRPLWNTHLVLWGAVQIVEEDGTPPVHPVDALPDTYASAGLLIAFVLKQQALEYECRGEASEHMGALYTRVCSSVQTLQSEGEHLNKKVSVTSLWGYCTDNIAAVIFVKGPRLQSKKPVKLQKFLNVKRDSIKNECPPRFTGGEHWPCSKRS